MKQLLAFLLLCGLSLGGCRAVEPEEVDLVAAVGFDQIGGNLQITVEVPLARQTGSDAIQTGVYSGSGTTVAAAMENLKSGLSKRLEFGHCALVVLGTEMGRAAVSAALGAVEDWHLPLSVTVVCASSAGQLLQDGGRSTPVGYEIPDILQILASEQALSFSCRYYEVVSANGNFALPQFLPEGKIDAPGRYAGLCSYQNGKAVAP